MADAHGNGKQEIEEYFTVYRPADAHQRLQYAAADVERKEEETFQKKYGICPGLFEHPGEQQQEQKGSQGHKVVKGQNPYQPFSQKKTAVRMGGEQDHKPADTKKDIYAESAAVQKTNVLQQDKKRRDAPQRLDAVKMHLMKIVQGFCAGLCHNVSPVPGYLPWTGVCASGRGGYAVINEFF